MAEIEESLLKRKIDNYSYSSDLKDFQAENELTVEITLNEYRELIKEKRVYFDGGTGTVLQGMGLPAGQPPEI